MASWILLARVTWRGRLLLGYLALALAGCGMQPPGRYGGGQGPGHRQQTLALSPPEEAQVGKEAYQKVLNEYADRLLPNKDPQVVRIRRIVGNIRDKALTNKLLLKEINLHLGGYRFAWDVHVVRERKINAFCLPAGYIIVYTGLLPVAQDDDQLAAVLGHEMAHALAHHASERVANEQRQGRSALGLLRTLSFDRQQESEADHIGLFLMTFAGYNPVEALRFWVRMEQSTGKGGGMPAILSDHPSDAQRIRDLRTWIPQALAAKRAYDEGHVVREAASGAVPAWPQWEIVYLLRRGNRP
jgi:predicted Zn-dependent protease